MVMKVNNATIEMSQEDIMKAIWNYVAETHPEFQPRYTDILYFGGEVVAIVEIEPSKRPQIQAEQEIAIAGNGLA